MLPHAGLTLHFSRRAGALLLYARHMPETHRRASDSSMKATRSMGRSIALNPSLPGTDIAAAEVLGPVEPREEQRDDTRGSWSSGCSADRMKP